jgi:hypothetical protein
VRGQDYWRLDSGYLDDSEHYDLLTCSLCGAVVHPSTKYAHVDWHERIADAIDLTEDIRAVAHRPLLSATPSEPNSADR